MSWQSVELNWPDSAGAIQSQAESVTDQVKAVMQSATGRLQNL